MSDYTHRLLAPGESYTFTVVVDTLAGTLPPPKHLSPGDATLKTTVWSETVITGPRPYARAQHMTSVDVDVSIQAASPSAPSGLAIANAVPEPKTWALMLIGLAAMGGALRGERRRSANAT